MCYPFRCITSFRKRSMEAAATEPVAFGVSRHTVWCWEFTSVYLDIAAVPGEVPGVNPAGNVHVISAFFGIVSDVEKRRDITAQVRDLVSKAAVSNECQNNRVEIPAVTRLWGDPAKFRIKSLEVTYERRWLTAAEEESLNTISSKVSDKAIEDPNLEDLLSRLSNALRTVARPDVDRQTLLASSVQDPPEDAPNLNATSPRWRQLGFQSNNPRTDLRTGRIALETMVHMAERQPVACRKMVRESQADRLDYPWAVVSINITQHLARMLDLTCGRGCVLPHDAIRRFARLIGSDGGDIFAELQFSVMQRLHASWGSRKKTSSELTIMDFEPCLQESLSAAHSFFSQAEFASVTEFQKFAIS